MAAKTQDKEEPMNIQEIKQTEMDFWCLGTSPLMPHAVSHKSKGNLLFPTGRKTAAEKATSMKHEPYEEFLDAAYKFRDEDEMPTRLYMPAGAFHTAMGRAAVDMIGAKKAQVGRLTSVLGEKVPIWGIPEMKMMVVRSADMARTPDIRTLPILPKWACKITVRFVGSLIKPQSIGNLLGAAGIYIGVGDGRQEKGYFSFGGWKVVDPDDKEFIAIVKSGGTAAQDKALADPRYYDIETEQLMDWFYAEQKRRAAAPAPMPRKARKAGDVVVPPKKKGNGKRSHVT